MSIETYGELKTAVADWSHRSDLTARIPDFIRLAENDFNRRTGQSHDLTSRPDAASNELLDDYPDVYLYGALMQMAIYTQDDAQLTKWSALYMAAMQETHRDQNVRSGQHDEALEVEPELRPYGVFDITTG